MPSHLHAVIGVRDYPSIAKFMQSFKILSSKNVKSLLNADQLCRFTHHGKYQFWQPRYDEFVIVSEAQYRTKIEYIHTNPVRAGLVTAPEEWMYSSARDWSGQGRGIVPIDRDFSFQR
jgi:REP element-mobilizing transposase RayT